MICDLGLLYYGPVSEYFLTFEKTQRGTTLSVTFRLLGNFRILKQERKMAAQYVASAGLTAVFHPIGYAKVLIQVFKK